MNLVSLHQDVQAVADRMSQVGTTHAINGTHFTIESSLRSGNDEIVVEVRLVLPVPSIPDCPVPPASSVIRDEPF